MILKKPFIYYYQKPEFKTVHNKQQEHNKENCRFSFRDTFNIYNYKYEVWEIFTPNLINYEMGSLYEQDVKYCTRYYINFPIIIVVLLVKTINIFNILIY